MTRKELELDEVNEKFVELFTLINEWTDSGKLREDQVELVYKFNDKLEEADNIIQDLLAITA